MIKRKLIVKAGNAKPEAINLSNDDAEELQHRAFMEGVTVTTLLHEAMALLFHNHREPLPQKLVDYLRAERRKVPPPAPPLPKRDLN